MFVKKKEKPSLNTRAHLSIIGMTADWCPVSLRKTLHKDLERHVENQPTDKRPGGYQILPPRGSRLLAPEKQNADAQDELPHEQAGC